ncbi:aspartate carbamoyltransferase [Patescibacteria group bacterium]|nr:aspartate carbamoyltransferase [Patescibacteria group bacterium]
MSIDVERRPELENFPENPFKGEHIISVDQFTPEKIDYLFGVTRKMREIVETIGSTDSLKGKILANLFYEPSTRTSSSFTAAMERLGGSVIPINEVRYSSVAKGENLPDTVRTLACYADIIVLRHPEVDSAKLAAEYSPVPVVNAGDGPGEHPTQALLDLFTIVDKFGRVEGKHIVMVGDLKYGRTVHSLAKLLSIQDRVKITFVSPKDLKMPPEILFRLREKRIDFQEVEELESTISSADVIYLTRVQKERFENQEEYEKVKNKYVVTPETLTLAKKEMILMHPLPRIYELSMAVDKDPRAVYIREQMRNGMYVRMALLAAVLGKV